MARFSKEERRVRLMARVANHAFTNNPTVLGRLAQRLVARMAFPVDPELEAELYEGLDR